MLIATGNSVQNVCIPLTIGIEYAAQTLISWT